MKAYYVDQIRGPQLTLLAGPFANERTAKRYEAAAAKLAMGRDHRAQFDSFGVLSITDMNCRGLLNSWLRVDTAELIPPISVIGEGDEHRTQFSTPSRR